MTTAYVTHPRYPEHDAPGHPEHAGRIRAIWHELETSGLEKRLKKLTPEPVSESLLRTAHSDQYIDLLEWTAQQEQLMFLDADTYILPTSYDIARLAAGGVVRAIDAIFSDEADNALAVVRPPGHHAVSKLGMGFCLLNNVAIATYHARQAHKVERVLIVDYDVHHGNGTQDIFYADPDVLFISTHQSPFYPGTGLVPEIGIDAGEGYTLNIPMPAGQGDDSYRRVFERIVAPAARRYKPDLIIVSAGFDAHWIDPLASMRLTLNGYAQLSLELKKLADELCEGNVVFVTEGGYNLESLAFGVCNVARVLLDDDQFEDPIGEADDVPAEDITPLLDTIAKLHNLTD